MRHTQMFKRFKISLMFGCILSVMLLNYSNCSAPVSFDQSPPVTNSSTTPPTPEVKSLTGTVTVGSTGTNPPLDLFFVVDNSASMAENIKTLGQSFSSIFQSNAGSLADFNVHVYLFSTASTLAPISQSSLTAIPNRSPAAVTSVPAYTDFSNLLATPGSVYGYWNSSLGTYGTAPFSNAIAPAPVLALNSSGSNSQDLSIATQGSSSAAQYSAEVNALTQDFQTRLSYLNPINQFQSGTDPVANITDVSSGLCSVARILKHSGNFIQPGDAAAFIIVSDDNDRLNDRNPNNNQCIESYLANDELVQGYCGHYQANYTYDKTTTVTYQSNTKFSYPSGTSIAYSYPATSNCAIQYNNGYKYSYTYTALNTTVSYTKCLASADGFCVSTGSGTVTLAGNFVASGGACTSGLSTSSLPSYQAGTTYTCAASNVPNQTGTGVDSASTGSTCSSALVSQLQAKANQTYQSCTITGASTTTKTISSQPLNSCSSYCSANSSTYPGCTLVSSTTNTTSTSLKLAGIGLTCASQCPSADSAQCGTGTIASYITTSVAGATCGSASNTNSTLSIAAGVDANGSALTCNSSISAALASGAGCAGAATVSACITKLVPGASCAVASGAATATIASTTPGVACSTTCSNSGGICTGTSTVQAYLATQGNLCLSSTNSGPQSLSLTFKNTIGTKATCSSLCSDVASGSCDGKGFGATDGSTVANYIQSLGGGSTCSGSVAQVNSGSQLTVVNSDSASSCTDPANPDFFASGAPYAGTATNYVAGDVNHRASDFTSFISTQSKTVFGANQPVVAVLGHMSGDTGLTATDASTDYVSLATAMNSSQVSTITAKDYSPALGKISSFIQQKTQNSFSLAISSSSKVYSVSIQKSGSQVQTPLDSSQWTWTGQTLSIASSVSLSVGDQIVYDYNP